jgi:hypothetical protein
MKLKTLHIAVITSLLTLSSMSYATNNERLIDNGAFVTPEAHAFKVELQKRANKKLLESASALANATGEPAMIDVGVVMHSSWIEAMKEPLTTNAAGKHFENGAQFAVARIKAQFDYFNETLAQQNVNARVRPVYFASVNSETEAAGRVSAADELTNMLVCVFWDESNVGYPSRREFCEDQGLKRVRDIVQGQVDLVYYVRERLPNTSVGGNGTYLSGSSFLDDYRAVVKSNIIAGVTEERLADFRFGFFNANIFSHELGHVMGAMHEVREAEPVFADGADNRAYACGIRVDGTPRIPNDLASRRKTIMWHSTGDHHRFFSDAEIVVDGDRCGVRGEANNIDIVRKNAPSIANNFTLKAATSSVVFVQDAIVVNRQEGKASIMLRRTGDLTKAAHLSMTAKDGTAWENRDFTFGLKEISFAAGESEKTVDVTLLSRAAAHPDTKFNLVFHAAMGATYAATEAEVTILSDKVIKYGSVQFDKASVDVTEGSTAQVQINRLNGTDGEITLKVTPADGTAINGTDYSAAAAVITMKNGEGSALVQVPTTKRAGVQGNRTVNLKISEAAGGAELGQIGQATLNIKDALDNGTLEFSTASVSVNENGSATLTINRTNGTEGEVGVRVQSVNGSAIAGTDFNAVDQVVTFPAGQASATVNITMLNRTGSQGARYFDVQMSGATGGAVLGSAATARVNIADVTAPVDNGSSGGGSGGSMGIFSLSGILALAVRRFKTVK